jgi:hypothetical protein
MAGKYFSYSSLLFNDNSNDFLRSGMYSSVIRIDWFILTDKNYWIYCPQKRKKI